MRAAPHTTAPARPMRLAPLLSLLALLALLCCGLLAGAAHAQTASFTPGASLQALFEVEGESPYPSPYAGTLTFSALRSRYDSGHGHGYRNELKIASKQRLPVAATREHFAATVTPTLPAGAKTIVAQYHVEGLDTILKIYVQDSKGSGMFDILARIKGTDGKETASTLGAVRSGDSFGLDIRVEDGAALVAVQTSAGGARQTARTPLLADGKKIYFKFGDYLQALDPDTHAHTIDSKRWDAYYQQQRIGDSQVRFSDITFERGQP